MSHRPENLAALLADPARTVDVPGTELPALLTLVASEQARLAAVQGALAARLVTAGNGNGADHMLSIAEAAARSGMSRSWLYRHHTALPFARKIGRKVVFSEQGLTRWLARRR